MKKIRFTSRIKQVIFSTILFVVLIIYYFSIYKTIPISYFDEFLWVGRSYFFEYFIRGDFNNPIWQNQESYDQPKLAEFAYGAWIYPLYIKEYAGSAEGSSGYTWYLIQKGLNLIGDSHMRFLKGHEYSQLDTQDSGPPAYYVSKYGMPGKALSSFIYYARVLDIILLVASVFAAYLLVMEYAGFYPALLFFVFYGSNKLVVETGLKAHSEALFLLMFNCAIYAMMRYFTRARQLRYLLLFALFAGFCFSTKLNGLLLFAIFFVLNLWVSELFQKNKSHEDVPSKSLSVSHRIKSVLTGCIPLIIGIAIFIAINPYTHTNPVQNIMHMFLWRMDVKSAKYEFASAYLPDWNSRIHTIFDNYYVIKGDRCFNCVAFRTPDDMPTEAMPILFVLGIIGFAYSFKRTMQNDISGAVIVFSFVLTVLITGCYLLLDWDRYFVHMTLFFVLLQSVGAYIIFSRTYGFFVGMWNRVRHIKRDT